MTPNPTRSAQTRPLVALGLSIPIVCSALLIAAAWSVRSEARDRDRDGARRSRHFAFGFDLADHEGRGFSYALVGPQPNTIVNSDGRDWEEIRDLARKYGDDVLWFSLHLRDYVVRDETTVGRAHDLIQPMSELGERQGRLGGEQGLLGARQSMIGVKQARIGARQALLSTRLARLALEDASEDERDAVEAEIDELGRKMDALAREQEPLARQQEELGRRQSELGRQMEQLSKRVNADMRRLAEDAIERGKAERVTD